MRLSVKKSSMFQEVSNIFVLCNWEKKHCHKQLVFLIIIKPFLDLIMYAIILSLYDFSFPNWLTILVENIQYAKEGGFQYIYWYLYCHRPNKTMQWNPPKHQPEGTVILARSISRQKILEIIISHLYTLTLR